MKKNLRWIETGGNWERWQQLLKPSTTRAKKNKYHKKKKNRARKHSLINAICQIADNKSPPSPSSSISNASNGRAIKRKPADCIFTPRVVEQPFEREKREKWKRYQTFGNERAIMHSHPFQRERGARTGNGSPVQTVSSFRVTSVDASFAFLANVLPAERAINPARFCRPRLILLFDWEKEEGRFLMIKAPSSTSCYSRYLVG